MRTRFYVLHWNDVWPVRCHHYSLRSARLEVAEQLRDFRRLGLRASILKRGCQWAIGAEIVTLAKATPHLRHWPRKAVSRV